MPDIWMDVDTAVTIAVNVLSLIDDTDFKSRETGITYDQAGMDLVWNFVTCAGVITQTAVTPTTGGDYDWTHVGDGIYKIEMTASGGASANNDTEGFGWFSGICTGVLPWRGPMVGFRAAGLNNLLIDSAHSATRGLAGTALPDAVADAAGGLPISDAGGLDVDAILADTGELQTNQGNWTTATGFATSGALTTHDGKIDEVETILKADFVIADPGGGAAYQITLYEEGTANVAVAAKDLKEMDDTDVTSLTQVIGKAEKP